MRVCYVYVPFMSAAMSGKNENYMNLSPFNRQPKTQLIFCFAFLFACELQLLRLLAIHHQHPSSSCSNSIHIVSIFGNFFQFQMSANLTDSDHKYTNLIL